MVLVLSEVPTSNSILHILSDLHGVQIIETTFVWDLLICDSFVWDHLHVRLAFSCDSFEQRKETIVSLLVFNFSVKNWNYCAASIKETGRNAKHNKLWLSLTKRHFRGATLTSKPKVQNVSWSLRCFKVRVHLQPSVSHFGRGRA